MGNATSCFPSLIICSTNYGVVKVLQLSNGNIQIYTKPVKAADLLDNSGQFVCDSSRLKVGHRIQGLWADEELERGQLYFLLPMDLLYSVLTHEEMASLSHKASKALRNKMVFPVFSELYCIFPSTIDEKPTTIYSDLQLVERYNSKQRSWKPALDTILEA